MNVSHNSVFNLSKMTKYDSDIESHVNSFVLRGCSVFWYVGVKNEDMYLCEIILQDEDKNYVFKCMDTFDYGFFFSDNYQAAFDFTTKLNNGIKAGKTMEEAIYDMMTESE